MDRVVTGMDPHKRSVTIEARDNQEVPRALGTFSSSTGRGTRLPTRSPSGHTSSTQRIPAVSTMAPADSGARDLPCCVGRACRASVSCRSDFQDLRHTHVAWLDVALRRLTGPRSLPGKRSRSCRLPTCTNEPRHISLTKRRFGTLTSTGVEEAEAPPELITGGASPCP